MDLIEMIKEFAKPELLILAPVLYLVGFAIRKLNVHNGMIPLILGLIGIALSGLYLVGVSDFASYKDISSIMFVAITQGILCAGLSVGIDQAVKKVKGSDEGGTE